MCRILESLCDLAVLCNCRQRREDPCKFTCRLLSCTALRYSLLRLTEGGGTTFVQPSALTHDCPPPPPLITPSQSHLAYLSGILLGVLSNARVWRRIWAGELLSLTMWLHVATPLGYTIKQVKKAAHSAVVCGLSTSPHEASCTVRYSCCAHRYVAGARSSHSFSHSFRLCDHTFVAWEGDVFTAVEYNTAHML